MKRRKVNERERGGGEREREMERERERRDRVRGREGGREGGGVLPTQKWAVLMCSCPGCELAKLQPFWYSVI